MNEFFAFDCRNKVKAMKAKFGQNFNVPAPPPQEESKEVCSHCRVVKPLYFSFFLVFVHCIVVKPLYFSF